MLPITKKLIKFNYSSGNDIKYIVVHDTANMDRGADAEAHYRYFNGGDRQSSAHYFVDDKEIVQLIEDYNASWHCGDGGGRYGITNHNSIGVEICVNCDCNYEKSVSNAVDLVKFLMGKYNVPIDKVVRHYDASRKMCPQSMSANNWQRWWSFKNRLSSGTSNQVANSNVIYGTVIASVLNVRSGAGTNYNVIGQLKNGQKVRLDKKVGSWWSIYFGDHGGYVYADYIK
ncbi:N-acetylmuramoyl-L-alanine amidase [Clostridium guangxiense]|uniref:N-acetylmuramoyl-L-alanine amidase n=1 Tax=Clostridium guangxiense TaxID=1662055 RepID=UPI001E46A001|nr:N-acetylmuramoyl-L-alanine amidase [Clostridium guangxiense]MCD2347174.1 N-acetylmuramoyl-L-alanine amidase [Clostridium guangxiense]